MEERRKKLREVKTAKRSVETSIRLFGPANITSVLDRETFAEKLDNITRKLEEYLETSGEALEEFEELRDFGDGEKQEYARMIAEINSFTEDIIKKVNDNEVQVKKKIEQVITESEIRPNNNLKEFDNIEAQVEILEN